MDRVLSVVIIGAGFSGLGMGVRLRSMAITDFVILEKASGVGGTWRDNTYPGAACDVESILYSFSFEPNPNWSRKFATQAEILAYLEHVADKYALRPHIRFQSGVVAAEWSERLSAWQLRLESGETLWARVLVSGTGGLSQPAIPALPGLDRFQGPIFHTARWRHDCSLENKTVAVVGTGASAIQVIPAIAPKVKKLKVFQRTPPWVFPKSDRPFHRLERALLRHVPGLRELARGLIYGKNESLLLGFLVKPELMSQLAQGAKRYLAAQVEDSTLRDKLTPDYAPGCKRLLLSNDYYPTLKRANVELVAEPVTELNARSIRAGDGSEHEVDVVIFATGFHVANTASLPFSLRGRRGIELGELWRSGGEAYLGTSVAGFPNLFLLVGPNTSLGHSSMILMIEAQVRYVAECLKLMHERRISAIEVKRDVQAKFNRDLQEQMAKTVWSRGGCASWYKTADGKNVALWPGSTLRFRRLTSLFALADYEATYHGSDRSQEHTQSGGGSRPRAPNASHGEQS